MSVNSKMTSIADKIRSLLGITGTMGLDAMATNLGKEQTNVANAFTAVGNKGGTVPSSKVSGNLASAIATIPEGVTVQKKTGTLTTNFMGTASVNVGFKPDIVAFDFGDLQGKYNYSGVMFAEANRSPITFAAPPTSTSYVMSPMTVTQTSNGFSLTAKKLSTSFSESNETNRKLNYVAIKYTE